MKKKTKKSQFNYLLSVKKTVFFIFCLSLFSLPGQNDNLNQQLKLRPSLVQAAEVILPLPSDYPVNYIGNPAPSLTAASALIYDRESAVVLFEKNPRWRLLPASTVKVMTALVAMDYYNPDQILTVNGINWEGQNIKLQEGEQLTVRSLLYGLLVSSGNDAAQVLAKSYPGGEVAFVAAMNQKANKLNLADSYFVNPTGMNDRVEGGLLNDLSFATALDMARLANELLKNPMLSQIVATPSYLITDISGKISHQLYNVNQLLSKVEGMKGVKTGWTEEAGECLISFVERDSRQLLVVVMGSQARFTESEALINWAFNNFRWEKISVVGG